MIKDEKKVLPLIGLISAFVLGFLFWLIYFKTGAQKEAGSWVSYLPALNAFFNTLTTTFLISGYVYIKNNNIPKHKIMMGLATLTSVFFLLSYITYHHYQGDTKFLGTGVVRPIYFFILITHILLSIVQVPLILCTLYFALIKNFVRHRKIARITFPVWLYVSVTGVLIFVILNSANG